MRRTTSAVLALCALAALAGRADEADPEPPGGSGELKKLQGTWTITHIMSGTTKAAMRSGRMTYTFDGDKVTVKLPPLTKGKDDRTATFKVKIDAKKEPHTIELVPEGGERGTGAIYKVEKGELFLAPGRPKGKKDDRSIVFPKDFSGEAGPVYVLKREKAKEKAKGKGKE